MTTTGYLPGQLAQVTMNIEDFPNIFFYSDLSTGAGVTGDSIATIQGTNYFSDGQKRGLGLGSVVFVITDYVGGAGVPVTHVCYVSALQVQTSGFGATLTVCPGST